MGGKLAKIREIVVENLRRYRSLDIGGLRLNTFIAHRGEFIQLIGHAAALPPHTQATGFAGVAAVQCLGGIKQANAGNSHQCVENFFGPATDNLDGARGAVIADFHRDIYTEMLRPKVRWKGFLLQ